MSVICARLGNKGKVGVQRGRKTAGCPSFLPTAVGTASPPPRGAARSRRPQTANPPAEVQRKTSRPERANTPAAVRVPRSADADKEPPRQGEHACGSSSAPLGRCEKLPARKGRTRLRQFAHPAQPVQKIREIPKKFSLPKRQKNAHSHAEKTPIRMTKLAKPNRAESGRKFLSKKCLTYWLGYANLYTWLAEAY